jgi:two-component system invasion response regulator UvrY
MKKIKVFIVDDHDFMLSVTKEFLEKENISVVGTVTSFTEATEHAFDNSPDILIIDLNIAGYSGIDLLKELKAKRSDCKVLIFSARTALSAMAAAYRVGAKGYLTKNNAPSELINALNIIHSNLVYFMPGYAEKILSFQSDDSNVDPRVVLSKREMELFVLIAKGISHDDAAKVLKIVPRSVATRIYEIRKKLGNTQDDFTLIANNHGISFIHD